MTSVLAPALLGLFLSPSTRIGFPMIEEVEYTLHMEPINIKSGGPTVVTTPSTYNPRRPRSGSVAVYVEYDGPNGTPARKRFASGFSNASRRFYVQQHSAGKNPRVIRVED